ncbi:MAG: hypothetical protein LBB41_07330, partial [Prevotellaceae bacterium]|nr:hypothetical protein [Prevotellaceae bacterium]
SDLDVRAEIEAKFQATTEIKRIDVNGTKLQLRSDGKIYKHEALLGWNRTPLSEFSILAITARKKYNLPLDKSQFSQEKINELENREKAVFEKIAQKADFEKSQIEEEETLLAQRPIETTVENLKIFMRHLRRTNWGSWKLPPMTIGYSAQSYDCDGVTAVTITLDSPISDEEYGIEKETKFAYGNPNRYLTKYQRLR